jgi:hypothetical protein
MGEALRAKPPILPLDDLGRAPDTRDLFQAGFASQYAEAIRIHRVKGSVSLELSLYNGATLRSSRAWDASRGVHTGSLALAWEGQSLLFPYEGAEIPQGAPLPWREDRTGESSPFDIQPLLGRRLQRYSAGPFYDVVEFDRGWFIKLTCLGSRDGSIVQDIEVCLWSRREEALSSVFSHGWPADPAHHSHP